MIEGAPPINDVGEISPAGRIQRFLGALCDFQLRGPGEMETIQEQAWSGGSGGQAAK